MKSLAAAGPTRFALCASLSLFALSIAGHAEAPVIPLVTGLMTVNAVYEPGKGDYEPILRVSSADPGGITFTVSANVEDRRIAVRRRVLHKDLLDARTLRFRYHEEDPETFAGTTALRVSDAVMKDLKTTGRTAVSVIVTDDPLGGMLGDLFAAAGLSGPGPGDHGGGQKGTLTRVEPTDVMQHVLVNDVPTDLPTIHARGTFDDENAEFFVLDDPAFPMLLGFHVGATKSQTIRITFPAVTHATELETKLARNRRAEVYGIYFDFAKATIRPESEAVLAEIADVLSKHPDWTLRLEGHTDNIGGAAANQSLSDRRTAATRQALIDRYHVAAARLTSQGFGASRPKDTNETIEGRARNRRVELVREDASK